MLLGIRNDLVEAFPRQLESTVAHVNDATVELTDDPSCEFFDFVLLVVILKACYIELAETVLDLFNERLLTIWIVLDEDALCPFELLQGLLEPTEHAIGFGQVRMHVIERAFLQRLLIVLGSCLMLFE